MGESCTTKAREIRVTSMCWLSFFNNFDVVFQQLGISLPVLITFASLEAGDNVIFDLESLVEEKSHGPLLTG